MYKTLLSPLNQEQNPSFEFSFAVYKLDLHSMIRTSGDDGKHDPVEESVDDTTSLSTGFTYKKCGGVCCHSSIILERKVGVGIGMSKRIKRDMESSDHDTRGNELYESFSKQVLFTSLLGFAFLLVTSEK